MERFIVAMAIVATTLIGAVSVGAHTLGQVIPPNLAVPSGHTLLLEALARGVQIYVCQPTSDNPSVFAWTLQGPEAELFSRSGERIGRHFAGPTWEGNDGSQVVGEVRATANSPDPQAIPWLLLQARANLGTGIFSTVTYIQRLDTVGGRAPTAGCDQAHAGQVQRVDYTATYLFYSSTATATATPGRTARACVAHRTGADTTPVVFIEVSTNAVAAHLAHGDTVVGPAPCPRR